MSKVATRFAPSPTGPLHIGGVRTAVLTPPICKGPVGDGANLVATFDIRCI